MSKIMKSLNGITEKRDQKYTLALQNHADVPPPTKSSDSQVETPLVLVPEPPMCHIDHNTVTLDKNVWYLSMICIVFMGLVALVLSVKAFTQIQRGNNNVVKLSKVILQQRSDIASLNTSVKELRGLKTSPVMLPGKVNQGLELGPNQREQQITEVLANMTVFNQEVKDLKLANQRLMEKLIDLNAEIKKIKTQARYSQNKGR
jgi:hypothetical protein